MDLEFVQRIENSTAKFFDSLATDIIKLPEATIILNKDLPCEPFLNYAADLNNPKNIPQLVKEVEESFEKHGAKPLFSISPYTARELGEYLRGQGYVQEANNGWMFFDPKREVPKYDKEDLEVKLVQNAEEFGEYADVFVEVFSKGEPDDPYKGLSPKWGDLLRERYRKGPDGFSLETYAVSLDDRVVGGAELYWDGEIAYMDGLAVLPKFRKLGVGKALQGTRVKRAKELGAKYICLITEVGSRNEEIFTRFGFKTEFTSQDLIKK